jgi:hypothetical protein
MPGSVSDSYDPEWGTAANAERIRDALRTEYSRVCTLLGQSVPLYILRLLDAELPTPITATLTEKQWRIIRFALERAAQSL